ncbi:LysR family transcriptional regulator [Panacagrimonas sp.]|uniref:LysR family transcriptional regulator n=1 Tax=Panacagrimonas sp. TaxID=2480088 RepID=UPI003B51B0D4
MTLGYMELRRLSYFVAVVEQRSFRAASLKLHLSQPPLTRQIQLLEEALGVQLLLRGPAGAEPTAVGQMFYEEARNLLALADQAADRVRLAGQGRIGRLDVGVFGSAVLGAIPLIVREFRERYPKVDVVLHSLDREAQLKALRERRLTVGFNRFFGEEPDLSWEVIQTERMNVVLPSTHPLAVRTSLALADIAREALILYPRAPRPGFIDYLMGLFHARSIAPSQVQEVDDVLTATALVASGLGLSLVTDSGRNLSIPGIVHRPLRPADRATVELCVIRRRDDDSALLAGFIDVARSLRGKLAGRSGLPPKPAAARAKKRTARR